MNLEEQLAEDRRMLEALKVQHKELKAAVAKEQEREHRSFLTFGVAKGLAEALSWKEMSPRLSSGVQKIFGAHEFLLYAFDDKNGWISLERRGRWAKEPPVAMDAVESVSIIHPPRVQEIVPVLGVPIYLNVENQRVKKGLMFLKAEGNHSENELIDAGHEFGEELGVAIAKALLFNQMETFSRLDGLTGTLRRQPFMDRMEGELRKTTVFRTPLSVMMIDVDHFKAVNDNHGHAAGDAVLKRIGEVLKSAFYETDVVGRYGGEEFIVLLPRSQAEGVLRKAEALRKKIESEVITSGFEQLRVTVSIGLAHYPEGGQTAQALIASADRALYQAKESGRNRVVAA